MLIIIYLLKKQKCHEAEEDQVQEEVQEEVAEEEAVEVSLVEDLLGQQLHLQDQCKDHHNNNNQWVEVWEAD